jgi:hypothetical protein
MGEGGDFKGGSAEAHEIRRFESAVWSLYVLSENEGLPQEARAACRLAADFAATSMGPGHPGVAGLMQLVIEVGGGEAPVPRAKLVALLREAGFEGDPGALDHPPPPLVYPPPRNLVSDKQRREAAEKVLGEIEAHLRDPKMPAEERTRYLARLGQLRASGADVRTQTERAWALLHVLERNRQARSLKQAEER